ncbi:MAG: hypothetical protein JXR96_29365 [Deltaproteobacteria bacterium]|nr:hypothetical protein [Deltaproteobacteria bacterium]
MRRTRRIPVWLLALPLVLAAGEAQARLEMGTLRLGLGLGLRSSSTGLTFAASGTFGVFALKGLEFGVDTHFQAGGDSPTLGILAGYGRYVVLPDYPVTPYALAGGGHLFVEGPDAWVVSAGGGVLYFFHEMLGLDIGVEYRWFFFPEETLGGFDVVLGLGLFF